MTTEDKFPTIRDMRDRLAELVERGHGDLPVQIVIVPASTLQAVARASMPDGVAYDSAKPALMIDFDGVDGRMPVGMVSTAYLQNNTTQ